jgi:hypothetical protein
MRNMVNNLEEENSDDQIVPVEEDIKSKSHGYRKLDLRKEPRAEVKQIYVKKGTLDE